MLVSQLTSAVVKVNGNQLCYKRVSSAFKSYQCHLYASCLAKCCGNHRNAVAKRQKFSLTKDVLHHHSLVYCTTWSRALWRWAAAALGDKAVLVSLNSRSAGILAPTWHSLCSAPMPVSCHPVLQLLALCTGLVFRCPQDLSRPLTLNSRLRLGPANMIGISFGFKFSCYPEMART